MISKPAWMINKFQFGPPDVTLCFVLANISQMKSYLEQQSLYNSESLPSVLLTVNYKVEPILTILDNILRIGLLPEFTMVHSLIRNYFDIPQISHERATIKVM